MNFELQNMPKMLNLRNSWQNPRLVQYTIWGRNLYTVMGVITMFFSGGMIPTYLLIKSLGMLDSFAVYIIPALFSYYDMVILMNFFRRHAFCCLFPNLTDQFLKFTGGLP